MQEKIGLQVGVIGPTLRAGRTRTGPETLIPPFSMFKAAACGVPAPAAPFPMPCTPAVCRLAPRLRPMTPSFVVLGSPGAVAATFWNLPPGPVPLFSPDTQVAALPAAAAAGDTLAKMALLV